MIKLPKGDYCYDGEGQCRQLLVPRNNIEIDQCLKYGEFIDRTDRGKKPLKCEQCRRAKDE